MKSRGRDAVTSRWWVLLLAVALFSAIAMANYPADADAGLPTILDGLPAVDLDDDFDSDAERITTSLSACVEGGGTRLDLPAPQWLRRSTGLTGLASTAWSGRALTDRAPPSA